MSKPYRVVLDTNVVFEGITDSKSECRPIIDAWLDQKIDVFVTNAIVYEYEEVLARQLSAKRWENIKVVLYILTGMVNYVTIYFPWRPSSPDPDDEAIIDCALTANAIVVTRNLRDFRFAQREFGLKLMTPTEFLDLLGV